MGMEQDIRKQAAEHGRKTMAEVGSKATLTSIGRTLFMFSFLANTKLAELERRLARIEEKGVVYRGVFNASDEYRRGDLVSHGGSIFHCTRPTQGVSPTHEQGAKALDHPWQLAVKRGRDARNG